MKNMVDIDVVLDDRYTDPKVTIQTKSRTQQVEKIIYAIENVSENDYPLIPVHTENGLELISQRVIVRVYTQGRKVMIQTDDNQYSVNKSLSTVEEMLNTDRFIRISQSEVVNLYKVKNFDINIIGTIGIEFENGTKSWASRSRVKAIKTKLKEYT
ncbi:MAG: LytTR family transcriptional regulator [Lachnospiraceae bacterium]|nr:LytTR family transcriptional regulator [Lachnospiraceae bacterium]